MIPDGMPGIGSTYVQWHPAWWVPVPGKDAEALPKFRPGCFDHQLGQVIPVRWPCGLPLGTASIENYRCADDGSGVWMTFRIVTLEGTPHEHG